MPTPHVLAPRKKESVPQLNLARLLPKKNILAVDPGIRGALVYNIGADLHFCKMPELDQDLVALLRDLVPQMDAILVEQVSGFMGAFQPGHFMFKFGRAFGFLLGILATLGADPFLPWPQAWQKILNLGGKKDHPDGKWKAFLAAQAKQMYPEFKVTLQVADAFLLHQAACRFDSENRLTRGAPVKNN